MFTRPLPLGGESSFEGLPKLLISGMLTAGVAVTQHVIEVYLTHHLNTPAIIGFPALKDVAGSIHYHRRGSTIVTFKRHRHGLDERHSLKIALPASTTIKHACSASYVFQPPSTKASVVGIILCVAVAIMTASAVLLHSNRGGVSESGSSTSSTSPSSSNALSIQRSSLQVRRAMLVTGSGGSGGNDPARGRDSGRRSSLSRRHQPSPLRQTLATAESGSPPPPPPPHFPPPAEDDDENLNGASSSFVDWISILLLIPIFLQLKKLFFRRTQLSGSVTAAAGAGLASDESFADTSSSNDLTCGNILLLPSPSAKVLPKPNPTTNRACQNVLPLTTSHLSTMVGSQDHPTHLPIHDPKNIEATGAGRTLRYLSTLAFMAGAFVSPLLPLFLFRLAVSQPELTEPAKPTGSVDGESSEEGEVYDMILERPEVRPVEDQVLARIAMHFRPLRDDFMDSESESDDVLDSPIHSKIQTPTPSDSPIKIAKLPPTPNALNPQASTFVPKKSRITHDERLARWKATRKQIPQSPPQLGRNPARTGESSSQIPQASGTANISGDFPRSSMNPWPQPPPPPARTPGSSLQSTDSGSQTGPTLTPNQKSSLRRKMRKRAQRERDSSQGDITVSGSSSNSMV